MMLTMPFLQMPALSDLVRLVGSGEALVRPAFHRHRGVAQF